MRLYAEANQKVSIRDGQKAASFADKCHKLLPDYKPFALAALAAAKAEQRDIAAGINWEQAAATWHPANSDDATQASERLKLYQAH